MINKRRMGMGVPVPPNPFSSNCLFNSFLFRMQNIFNFLKTFMAHSLLLFLILVTNLKN